MSDAALWDAVFDPALEEGLYFKTARRVREVRALFVDELGWGRASLEQFRFRAVARLAESRAETVTVRLRSPAQHARLWPREFTETFLRELGARRLDLWDEFGARWMPDIVEDRVSKYSIELSDQEYARIREYAARAAGNEITDRDARAGNPELSRAVVTLLDQAYGKGAAQ